MTWLTPWAGLIVAAAVIPPLIVLYFLKLRRRSQAISTTLLWKRSIEDLRANAPFQKLRKSLLLLLQLIALALLAISVAQPQIQAGRQKGGKTVILIDNSASMTATDVADGNATRLDEAKRRAREKIELLYSGGMFASSTGETMIVVFSDRAEIYSRFSDSKQQLLAAIDRIQPTHGESRIEEALKLARAFTTNVNPDQVDRPIAEPATLELYSDGRITDLTDQILRGEKLNYYAIGSPEADNVAIGSISVERPYDRPNAIEVFVALLNYNLKPVDCDIQISVDDQARGIEDASIDAAQVNPSTKELIPGRANVVFTPFDQPRGVVIEVANLRHDDLLADNVAQIVVAPPSRLAVALVTQDFSRSIVLRALEGMKLQRLEQITPQRYEELAINFEIDQFDLVVFDNHKPKAMPPARYLSFGPTPPIEGLNEFGQGEQQIILSAKDEHPALRSVNYDSLFISKFIQIQPAVDVLVLMEGSNGPAIVAISRGSMQVIHCTFDPLESNWPFQQSFVTFLVNAVDFLGHAGKAITNQGLAPGEAITARLPVAATDVQILTPHDSRPQNLEIADPAQFAWGPIRLAGTYALSWKTPAREEREELKVAANLFSETEGRIEVNQIMEIGQESFDSRETPESAYTPLWPWAIGVCLCTLMLEWWVYHRKAYV